MITDYPLFCRKKRWPWGTDMAVGVAQACKWWGFKSFVVWSQRIKHILPPPSPKQNSEIWDGWGALIPSPKAVVLECVPAPPPLIFHSVFASIKNPMQSMVAKLLCNSCAPYPPLTRLSDINESPRLLPCWAYVIGLGEWKSTKYRGNYAHFLGNVLFLFQHFFSSVKPPSPSHGLCYFS